MQSLSPMTYFLPAGDDSAFYEELARFTDELLAAIEAPVEEALARFRQFIVRTGLEEARSEQEYLVEFLAIGLFYQNYSGHAARSNRLVLSLLTRLFTLRKRFSRLKPAVDRVRGVLITGLLHANPHPAPLSRAAFLRVLRWLDATGDFREEVVRLQRWRAYFDTLTDDRVVALLTHAVALAERFRVQAHAALGQYTRNIEAFIRSRHAAYRNREDYVFCGRGEAEYHLNMVAAEILNRALRAGFLRAPRKAVLLPTCMCAPGKGACRAAYRGREITCTSCTATCPAHLLKTRLQEQGVATFLIPHSSSFSQFLEQWQGQKDIALVGVACVLNLLTGGYEMMKLGIASQCVFLDYSGCRKHWHPEGIPTNLNTRQLLKVIDERYDAHTAHRPGR